MSRSRIDWEKGNREQKGHDTLQSFATHLAEENEASWLEMAQQAKIKKLLFDRACRSDPAIANSSYITKKLIYDSRIRILARESLSDTLCQCECEMCIDYAFGHKNLGGIDIIVSILKAIRPENSYNLLFWFECPQAIFDVVE